MTDLISLWNTSTLAEQFQAGAVLIVCVFLLVLSALFVGPSLLAGARGLFPDETLEDDEQRLVDARRRRLEAAARVPHQADAASRRAILEAIAHMPHPTNRIH